ncbi:MAG: hypothetical protein ACKVT0_17420, partial [Planctomycetaceae bacterium]
MRFSRYALCLTLVILPAVSAFAFPRTATDANKNSLTKKHGPWMIMVASIRPRVDNPDEDATKAYKAADDLVKELRKNGIPAYKFVQKKMTQE